MHCWARYLFIAVVAVLGTGQMIAACGQKGDLYLPEPEKQASRTTKPTGEGDAAHQVQAEIAPEAGEKAASESAAGQPGGQ